MVYRASRTRRRRSIQWKPCIEILVSSFSKCKPGQTSLSATGAPLSLGAILRRSSHWRGACCVGPRFPTLVSHCLSSVPRSRMRQVSRFSQVPPPSSPAGKGFLNGEATAVQSSKNKRRVCFRRVWIVICTLCAECAGQIRATLRSRCRTRF